MTFASASVTRRGALAASGLAAVGLAAACSKETGTIENGGETEETPASAAVITVTPADGATDATAATEIAWTVEGGEFGEFTLTDAEGTAVEGAMHPDGTTWVPASPLAWEQTYTATVTATDPEGLVAEATSTFTTIASPGNRVSIENYIPNDTTVGMGAILAFRFIDYEIPEDLRPAVERRLFVTSEPAQEGSWHWINGRALEYRPEEYWQPNTEISVRLGLGGLDIGEGRYGEFDQEAAFTIDSEQRFLEADNETKQMRAYLDGTIVQTIPISLGSDTPIDGNDARSYSGTMTIMSREQESTFVSELYDYETDVKWAMRLTFSGQFIHGAPWATDRLGVANGSHGCINVTDEMGEWVYNFVRWGDPVTVLNTGREVPQGDGFTGWTLDWETFKSGSYLD